MLFVWGVDTSAGAGSTGVVAKGFLAEVRGSFRFREPRRAASWEMSPIDETSISSKEVRVPHVCMNRSTMASAVNGCVKSPVSGGGSSGRGSSGRGAKGGEGWGRGGCPEAFTVGGGGDGLTPAVTAAAVVLADDS